MQTPKDPSLLEMVRHWRRVGPLLEEIRVRELRALNPDEGDPLIDELLKMMDAIPMPIPTTSGLVEQQRRFRKIFGGQTE